MTPKEAIEYLNIMKLSTEDDSVGEIKKEAFDIAIEALEKQIPKKPNKTRYTDGTLCCPDCLWDAFDEPYEKKLLSYCPSCGQAIDWSEEE